MLIRYMLIHFVIKCLYIFPINYHIFTKDAYYNFTNPQITFSSCWLCRIAVVYVFFLMLCTYQKYMWPSTVIASGKNENRSTLLIGQICMYRFLRKQGDDTPVRFCLLWMSIRCHLHHQLYLFDRLGSDCFIKSRSTLCLGRQVDF